MAKEQILIVEDEIVVAEDIRGCLEDLGYEVAVIANTGEEAVRLAEKTCPSLVLMDIRLDGAMDGVEAAQQIRTNFDIPVIFLTAHSDINTLQRAKITEPFGYILKPYKEKELYTAIEIALYKHKREEKLRKNEQWYSTTLKSISEAVITTDVKGIVSYMNPAAEALTGWKQEDALGKNVTKVFRIINEENATSIQSPVQRSLREDVVVDLPIHTILVAKNKKSTPIVGSAAGIRDDIGEIIGAALAFMDITEFERIEERRLEQEKLKLSDKVQKEIGQDLHDDLGQYLISISFMTKMLAERLSSNSMPEVDEAEMITGLVKQAMNRTSELAKGLKPVKPIANGLMHALQELASNVKKLFNISCVFNCQKPVSIADTVVAEQLFRIAQEAVNNAIKHGKAKHVFIDLRTDNDRTVLAIKDDGIGFSKTSKKKGGLGLQIMKYRAEKIGASLDIKKVSTGGTTVICSFQNSNIQEKVNKNQYEARIKPKPNKTKVLIVEDHRMVRQGLSHLINQEDDLIVCGEAEDAHQTIEAIAVLKPDFVLVDISLKESNGLHLIENMKKYYAKLPILVFSAHDETIYADRALRAGAKGYIMKQEGIKKVIKAIRQILNGDIYVSDKMEARILQNFVDGRADKPSTSIEKLSDRELEVFQLIGLGYPTSQIAEILYLSVKTVETYRAHIKKKLNLKNATELLQHAIKWQLSQNTK